MTTLGEFILELLLSIVQLVQTFVFDVLVTDPLSAISLLIGFALVGGASAALGYLALGALADWLGDLIGSPAGRRPPRD